MASRRTVDARTELLELAAERVKLPDDSPSRVDYQADADLLYITFTERPRPTRTREDLDADVIYNYEGDRLVSLEILDLYGVYADAATPRDTEVKARS